MAELKSDDVRHPTTAPKSIESLYAAIESDLLTYALRLVQQDETAQDIVQEAFMKLHVQYATVKQPQAWLFRTVHNLALNHLRDGRKIVSMDPGGKQPPADPPDPQPVPDEYLQRMEAIGQTRLCLAELDARSREMVRLKFEECLSYKEISERTHVSIGNVGFILHHALKDLGASLKKAGVSL